MCIILYNEIGKKLDKNLIQTAYDNNPHGYGFMWYEHERIHTIKGLADFDQIWQLINMFNGMQYAMHFRWRTTGEITNELCHPFEILNKDAHGLDMVMMHNGTIFSMPKIPNKSDTQIFSEKFSQKIIEKDPNYNLNYIHKLEQVVGKHNKMVMMTSDKRTFFVNKNEGKYIDGIWYSNTYSFEKDYRKPTKKEVKTDLKQDSNTSLAYTKRDYGTRVIRRKDFVSRTAFSPNLDI